MAKVRNWADDPVTWIEKRVRPVLPALAVCATSDGAMTDATRDLLRTASDALRKQGQDRLSDLGVDLSEQVRSFAERAADSMDAAMSTPPDMDRIMGEISPAIDAALDGFRKAVFQSVSARQQRDLAAADLAVSELRMLARKIYFVSINASVEAARSGEAGKGFSVISRDIRDLSEQAKRAIERMGDGENDLQEAAVPAAH